MNVQADRTASCHADRWLGDRDRRGEKEVGAVARSFRGADVTAIEPFREY
jgi:hypothetical protein